MFRFRMNLLPLGWLLWAGTTTALVVWANPFAPAQSQLSAETEFMSTLLQRATPLHRRRRRRHLANNNNNHQNHQVNLSAYSIVFQKCLFAKTFNDHLAKTSGAYSIVATERFVQFRLCPTLTTTTTTTTIGDCSTCRSNNNNNDEYGEYLIDLYDYLTLTSRYHKVRQVEKCNECGSRCSAYATDDQVAKEQAGLAEDDDDDRREGGGSARMLSTSSTEFNDCHACLDECQFLNNYANEGYYDATEFISCTKVYDDGSTVLYIGPICTHSGHQVKIGVFTDDNCYDVHPSEDPSDYLKGVNGERMQLSYHLLKETYSPACISCAVAPDNNSNNNNNDQGTSSPFCTELYDKSAKCESPAFSASIAIRNNNNNNNDDDIAAPVNNTRTCNYIHALSTGTYNEFGEISIMGASRIIPSDTTGARRTFRLQMVILTCFVVGTVGMAVYAAKLHALSVRQIIVGSYASLSPLLLHPSQLDDPQETEMVELR